MFVAGYKGYYRVTDTTPAISVPFLANKGDVNDRTDHTLTLAYSQLVCPKVIVQPFYRFQYTHYTGSSRNDALNTVGLFIHYNVCKYASARAFASYERRDTDNHTLAADYDKVDAGLGVSLNVKF
jgi:hypothetical protein